MSPDSTSRMHPPKGPLLSGRHLVAGLSLHFSAACSPRRGRAVFYIRDRRTTESRFNSPSNGRRFSKAGALEDSDRPNNSRTTTTEHSPLTTRNTAASTAVGQSIDPVLKLHNPRPCLTLTPVGRDNTQGYGHAGSDKMGWMGSRG